MTIFVNNQPVELTGKLTIPQLLRDQQVAHLKGLAIAINDFVITKSDWEQVVFQENDQVTIIRASQGG
ncbi:sulfur carrier protein ThiS [Pseudarcicella hirudinis]|uniref:Sulfur carrier protein ThiS n=1 Tax=Pseudarcicella hirudinis TaxID=1079859 RepID=A0A1I5MAZ9_9BACT|nr:sulfur carrier protein ThiS [Pseudarcicella hirudinis]SFP06808.1 sulfur carrier protein ThiS [Pseudarcicella hirudinis]